MHSLSSRKVCWIKQINKQFQWQEVSNKLQALDSQFLLMAHVGDHSLVPACHVHAHSGTRMKELGTGEEQEWCLWKLPLRWGRSTHIPLVKDHHMANANVQDCTKKYSLATRGIITTQQQSSMYNPIQKGGSNQFSSVQSLSRAPLFATPWITVRWRLCPLPTPGVYSNSRPLSQWYHWAISSSVVPFSSCPQSFPASGSFQMSQFFPSGGQSIVQFQHQSFQWIVRTDLL